MTVDFGRFNGIGVSLLMLAIGTSAALVPVRGSSQQMPAMSTPMMDWGRASFVLFDELEYIPGEAGRPISFEALGWYGGAYNRLWFRTEGEQNTRGGDRSGELELLFGRLISPYWDAVVGTRFDRRWDERSDGRMLFAVGILGEAPLRFEFAPTLYVSTDGDVSARLDAAYQFLLTQRIILEPSLDINAAARAVPEFGVGSGLNEVVLAARLRYEVRRKFGPYVGFHWKRSVGSTATLERARGRDPGRMELIFGLRLWR